MDIHPAGFASRAQDITSDESSIVGSVAYPGAFIRDADPPSRFLESVLVQDYGLELGGWSLDFVAGISDDGRTIAGSGYNPDDELEAWIVRPPQPGPADLDGEGLVGVTDPVTLLGAPSGRGLTPGR